MYAYFRLLTGHRSIRQLKSAGNSLPCAPKAATATIVGAGIPNIVRGKFLALIASKSPERTFNNLQTSPAGASPKKVS